jgi:hypothetical protein
MTLPVSGAISFNDINVELGVAGTTQASLNQASYRTLAGVPSGAISMSDFYGKANQFAFTISSNQTNANLATLATAAGWNGTTKVVATINSGVFVSANSTGTPGLTVNGSFPGGVELINNGSIIGMGGGGGKGGQGGDTGKVGLSGGLALTVSVALTLRNNGTIGGGGGGGGGGGWGGNDLGFQYGGGGGGGGRTGTTNSPGGQRGIEANIPSFDGASGTSSGAGNGGASSGGPGGPNAGGNGGNWGSSGSAGQTSSTTGGGGGGAGAAITGNSNITYLATGTRLGAIS